MSTIVNIMRDERIAAPTFEQAHPFRVPMSYGYPDLRFAGLNCAARSAAYYRSCVVDERPRCGQVYPLADCIGIVNALRDSLC